MIKIPTRVMIVDDEKDFVEILSLRLTEVGEKVSAAFSGRECLEKLKYTETDVVILDMEGREAMRLTYPGLIRRT